MIFSILAGLKTVGAAIVANPMAAATLASGAVGAYGSVQQGKAQADVLKEQARQEKIQAEADELLRREELNRQLAAMVAAASTAGYTGGTPESIGLYSAQQAGKSERSLSLKSRLSIADKERQAKAAKSAGTASAVTGVLKQAPSLIPAYKKLSSAIKGT